MGKKKKKWAQISKTTVSTLNCAKSEAILRIWGKRTVKKATETLVSGIGFSPFWNSSLACLSPPYLKTILYLPVTNKIDSSFRQKAVQTLTQSMLLKNKFFHATHLIFNLGKVTRQIKTIVLLSKQGLCWKMVYWMQIFLLLRQLYRYSNGHSSYRKLTVCLLQIPSWISGLGEQYSTGVWICFCFDCLLAYI